MVGIPKFVDRTKMLLVLGVSAEEWADRYDLEPFESPCYKCGKMHTTDRPFAYEDQRGLMAPQCECGHPTPPYCVVIK
jgi:hypothetical protein